MNKVIVLSRIYKNGSLGTSIIAKPYLSFTLIDQRKTREDAVKFRSVSFGDTAERIDAWCHDGDQVLAFGLLEKDQKTNSFSFIVNEFQRTGQKSEKPFIEEENLSQDFEKDPVF